MGGRTEQARPPAPPARLVDLLDLADRTVGACLARISDTGGIGREQWRILVMLDEGSLTDAAGRTMGEIAARAGVPAPTATRMVDRLVADGLAHRRSDPWDRRRVLVHVSPEGHALVERVAGDLDDAFGTVLADLDAQDRVDILGVLARMNAALGDRTRARTS